MEKLIAKPQLGFTEANQLVASRLTDFNGRSRRSEYWWTMLSFIICIFLISMLVLSLWRYSAPTSGYRQK